MTELEKKAEKYRISKRKEIIDNDDFEKLDRFDENVEEAYIAGARENGVEWHDLRKDPTDLPKGHRVVLNQVGAQTNYDPKRGFLGFEGVGVIAWCEIPLFKE